MEAEWPFVGDLSPESPKEAVWGDGLKHHHLSSTRGGSDGKESACNAGDPGLIPGLGRSPEGNGNPFQDSCPDNPTDRGAWWAAVHGVAKSQTGLRD